MTAAEKQGLRYLAVAVGVLALLSAILWLGGLVRARSQEYFDNSSPGTGGSGTNFTAVEPNPFRTSHLGANSQKHFTEHVHVRRKIGPNGKVFQYISKWYVLYGKKYWKPFIMEYDDQGRLVSTYWGNPVRTSFSCPQCGLPCVSVKFHPQIWQVSRTETIYPKANVAPPKYDEKYELDYMFAYARKFWRVRNRQYLFYHQKWNLARTSYSEVYLLPNSQGRGPTVNPLLYVNWESERPAASTGGWRYTDWPAQAMTGEGAPSPEELMREFVRYGKIDSPEITGGEAGQ